MKEVQFEQDSQITTTIGDLIATISEVALQAGKTEQEGYQLASLALRSILRKQPRGPKTRVVLN